MMQTQADTAATAMIDWDSVKPGDPCPTAPDDETLRDCPFRWAETLPGGMRKTVWECTRPVEGHTGKQHVAEGREFVESVRPW